MTEHSNTLPGHTSPQVPSRVGERDEPYRTCQVPEGAEPPPKGVRVAGLIRWLILLGMAALALHTVWKFWGPGVRASVTAHAEDQYYCPMHPQIRSHEQGECPICHMNLEPIPRERQHVVSQGGTGTGGTATGEASSDAPQATMSGIATGDGTPDGVVPVTLPLERQQLVGITTMPVTRRTVGANLRVPGVAETAENSLAQVHVRTPGFIERVAVRETGVHVTKGQPLAWYYSPQIYQAQQELLTVRRWAAAPTTGGTTPLPEHSSDVGHGTPAIAAQSAEMVGAARRNLQLLGMADPDIDAVLREGAPMRAVPIRAPAPGHVTRFAAQLGMYATPETALYELADLSHVWIIASVYERDVPRIQRGMTAKFVTAENPITPLEARVDLVEPEVTVTTRTARVRLQVRNPQLRLRPGQYGDVVFDLPASSALTVPRDAVIDTGTQQYVFVDLGSGRFEPRRVRVGGLFEDHLEVLEGLHEGERIVARGSFMLDSESRLQASLAEAPVAPTGGARAASSETGPDCETAFDRQRFPDKYTQCRACERMHRSMGSMEADCKNAIGPPWR